MFEGQTEACKGIVSYLLDFKTQRPKIRKSGAFLEACGKTLMLVSRGDCVGCVHLLGLPEPRTTDLCCLKPKIRASQGWFLLRPLLASRALRHSWGVEGHLPNFATCLPSVSLLKFPLFLRMRS